MKESVVWVRISQLRLNQFLEYEICKKNLIGLQFLVFVLYLEENFFRIKRKRNTFVVGGSFAIYDNKKTLKEMKDLYDNALKQAMDSMTKKPK